MKILSTFEMHDYENINSYPFFYFSQKIILAALFMPKMADTTNMPFKKTPRASETMETRHLKSVTNIQ